MWFLLGFAAVVVPSFAFAANVLWSSMDSVLIRDAGGSVRAVPGVRQLLENVADGSGGVSARASQPLNIGSSRADLSLSKNVPKSSVASAGRLAARVLGPVALASLAYEAYLIYDETTGWSVPGVVDNSFPQGGWNDSANGVPQKLASPQAVCDVRGANVGQVLTAVPASYDPENNYECRRPAPNSWQSMAYPRRVEPCVLEGWQWSETEQGCRQAPSVPATDTDIETAIGHALDSDPSLAPTVLDRGVSVGYQPVTGPLSVTGPSSIPGPSTTSTTSSPSGQTTTTTNTTHNLTYNTNIVTVSNTTTTTTVHPDATETTTVKTDTPGGEGVTPEEPEKPFCEQYPDASACQELGHAEDEQLDEETEDVDFQQEGGAAGSCPASVPFWAGGTAQEMSWQPTCDFASGIRPFVIGLSWLSAGIFVFAIASRKA